jgi:predicted metal-binding protein
MSVPNARIKEIQRRPTMNDYALDDYYATVCPSCHENSVDDKEEMCTHCLLEEMSATYNEDIALEMSLGLDC